MKSLNEYLIFESNKDINKLIDNDDLNKFKLSRKQYHILKYMINLHPSFKYYLVDGKTISKNIEIENHRNLIADDERGILCINDKDDSKAYFINTSKIKDKKEKETYVYSWHTYSGDEHADDNSLVLTVNDDNTYDSEFLKNKIKH